jgi:hypothetical protein
MVSILQYPFINASNFTVTSCLSTDVIKCNPVYNWLLYGKIAETGYSTPEYQTVTTLPSGKNRYLSSVVTTAIPASSGTVSLAVGGELILTIPQSVKVETSDVAIASAEITNEATTITAVAAGTATVTISDSVGNTISTIDVVVA